MSDYVNSFKSRTLLHFIFSFQDMAEARKNTLLYHFNAMNVVKKIQNILKLQPSNGYGETFFTAEEIHKVHKTDF